MVIVTEYPDKLAHPWFDRVTIYNDGDSKTTFVTDARAAYGYAYYTIGGRWLEGEWLIKTSPEWAYRYALYVIKDRWPEAEEIIKTDPKCAYSYAYDVIGGRWPEGEEAILKCPVITYEYIVSIIKDKWAAGEYVLKEDSKYYALYNDFLEGIGYNGIK